MILKKDKFKNKNLILSFFSSIKSFVTKGHQRSVKAKKNIIALFAIKGGSILISLILVPLTVNYLNPTRYGIWLTLSSIIGWLGFFDIGFGNGLRNKLAENIAKKNYENAKVYVSTTYAMLTILIAIAICLFTLANPFLNWATILNAPQEMGNELRLLSFIVFIFFCFQFVLQLLNTIITANQEPAKASLLNFVGNLLSLILILIIVATGSGNLIYIGIAFSIAPIIVLSASSVWFFRRNYRMFAPSIKFIRFEHAKSLINLGIKFFIIQIAALVLFQTDNIVITQIFSPKEVTIFNIAFKLFSTIIMIFTIIAAPLWSAFTEAHTNNDFSWIKNTLSKMRKIWLLLSVLTIIVLFLSQTLYKWWMGNAVQIPFVLSAALAFYVIVYVWQSIHVFFLNGIGKIKLQLYLVIISGALNIPLAIFLGKKIGLAGVTLSNAILFLILGIIFSIQVKKINNNTAKGIWIK